MEDVLFLAVTLFALGLIGLLTRRNLIFTLLCIEVMLNASGLAFVAGSYQWGRPDGQIMFLFILAMAAAEVSVALALFLQFHRGEPTLDSEIGRASCRERGD